MCGIVGLIQRHHAPPLTAGHPVHAGLAAIAHRGPDEQRAEALGCAVLGTARLAMVDRPTSSQPMRHPDGRFLLVFNGEIYNYRELRADLAAEGVSFATAGDTEVLLAILARHGVAGLSRLRGQFALACWDDREQELLLARDRFGIVPLFFRADEAAVGFCSEVKGLRAMGLDVPLSVVDVVDAGVLWGTHPGRSVFAGVESVPPGGWVVLGRVGVRRGRYWSYRYADARDETSLDHQGAALRELLTTAVQRRVPDYHDPAVLVSGGLDSTAVLALLRERIPSGRIASYSIQFSRTALDEGPFQAVAAAAFDTDHTAILCGDTSVAQTLVETVLHAEAPLTRTASASSIALAATIAAQGTRCVLSGEGADELLCGYDLFKVAAIRDAWSRDGSADHGALVEVLAHQRSLGRAVERAFYEEGVHERDDPLFSHLNRWRSSGRITRYLADDIRDELGVETILDGVRERLPAPYASWSAVEQAQYLEVTYFLASALLASQCDRPYMAHSIEARYPFLDEDVVDFALTLPQSSKLAGTQEKAVLHRAVAADVPRAITDRVKQPYTAPEGDVFRTAAGQDLLDAYAGGDALAATGLFDAKRVRWLTDKLRRRPTSFHDDLALLWIVSTQILASEYGVSR